MLAPLIFVGILFVIGIPGNILILLVFGLKHKSSVYRTIILAMAVYDMLVCTITLPFEFYSLYNHFSFSEKWACKIFRTTNYFLVFNSSSIIELLAVERFRRVCRPLKRQMSEHVVLLCIVIICVICCILTIPNVIIHGILTVQLDGNTTGNVCSISDEFVESDMPTYYNGALLIICISNITIVIILYIFIGRQIFKHFRFLRSLRQKDETKEIFKSKRIGSVSGSQRNVDIMNGQFSFHKGVNKQLTRNDRDKRSKIHSHKSTITAIMITVFFIISYIPTLAENIIEDIYGEQILSKYVSLSVLNILQRTFAINHVINPFIYGFVDKTFRKDCKDICCSILNLSHKL